MSSESAGPVPMIFYFLTLSHIFLYFNDLGISLYKKGENLLACAQHYLYLQH